MSAQCVAVSAAVRAWQAWLLAMALAAPAAAEPAWTLRAARNSTPVALTAGPGSIRQFAIFCLSGEPFLAAIFRDPPRAATLRFDFAFADARFVGPAAREASAGGAYVIGLRDQPLARLLAGRARSARVAVADQDQGTLSLSGSSDAIRAALASCQAL